MRIFWLKKISLVNLIDERSQDDRFYDMAGKISL